MEFCIEVEPRGERRFVNMFMLRASQYMDGAFYMLWHRIFQKLRRRPYVKKIWIYGFVRELLYFDEMYYDLYYRKTK